MSITVLVQRNHVIFDDKGSPMSPGTMYKVKESELISGYISEGALSVVEPVEENLEVKADVKKTQSTKSTRTQETDAANPQENANG